MKARSQAHSSPGAHLHSSALTRRPRKGRPEERADVTDRAASSPFTAKFHGPKFSMVVDLIIFFV